MTSRKKHTLNLFHVNSYISYAASVGIINYYKIQKRDYIFLFDGRVRYNFDPQCFRLNYNSKKLSLWRRPTLIFATRRIIRKIDSQITAAVQNRQFNYYTYGLKRPISTLISSHPLCQSLSVFEEGLAAYRSSILINALRKDRMVDDFLLKLFYFSRELRGAKYFYDPDMYLQAYALTKGAMRGFPRRIQLDLFGILSELGENIGQIGRRPEKNAAVFVLSPLRNEDYITFDATLQAIRFAALKEYPIYLKLHPVNDGHQEHWKKLLIHRLNLRSDNKVSFLPASYSLEILAARRPDLNFCVNNSSVGIYASELGAAVYDYSFYCTDKNLLSDIITMRSLEEIPEYGSN